MTSLKAFTHGQEPASHARKGRFRSSCEAHGRQVFGQKRNSPAIRSNGSTLEAVGMSSVCGRFSHG